MSGLGTRILIRRRVRCGEGAAGASQGSPRPAPPMAEPHSSPRAADPQPDKQIANAAVLPRVFLALNPAVVQLDLSTRSDLEGFQAAAFPLQPFSFPSSLFAVTCIESRAGPCQRLLRETPPYMLLPSPPLSSCRKHADHGRPPESRACFSSAWVPELCKGRTRRYLEGNHPGQDWLLLLCVRDSFCRNLPHAEGLSCAGYFTRTEESSGPVCRSGL